jgi:hypothetical protein
MTILQIVQFVCGVFALGGALSLSKQLTAWRIGLLIIVPILAILGMSRFPHSWLTPVGTAIALFALLLPLYRQGQGEVRGSR